MGSKNFLTDDEDVVFIKKYLQDNFQIEQSENDINYIVDLIYEYYEKVGMFDQSKGENDELEIDEDEVANFVIKSLSEDGMNDITEETVHQVIEGEFAYCQSIGIFE